MKIQLIKLAKELNIGISPIVDLLISNGYECEEDPAFLVTEDIADFIRDNLVVKESEQNTEVINNSPLVNNEINLDDAPVGVRIIKAVEKEIKFVERVIGYTAYDWKYLIYHLHGYCSQPIPFNVFDEVISGLLLRGKQLTRRQIGALLGLDVINDSAENEILLSALNSLLDDQIIGENENGFFLTPKGIEFTTKGAKVSIFERNFDIYIDPTLGITENGKAIFGSLRGEKIDNKKDAKCDLDLEQVRALAEVQAPEVHFPDKDFILQKFDLRSISTRHAHVLVVLLENFRDKTIRALVYDEDTNTILQEPSRAIDNNETLKNQLYEQMIQESKENEFRLEVTTEQKSAEQLKDEELLIAKQEEYDLAINANDLKLAEKIKNETTYTKTCFLPLEFEAELKKYFDNTTGEIWLLSSWIKGASKTRIPSYINYMKKGGRIFIGYSLPEEEGKEMANPWILQELLELEKKYTNFYICQLSPFHFKRVYIYSDVIKQPFHGSYNILSYDITKLQMQNIREEDMIKLPWNPEYKEKYNEQLVQFGRKYMAEAKQKLIELIESTPQDIKLSQIKKFESLTFDKLQPFINKGISELDDCYKQLKNMQSEHVTMLRGRYLTTEINSLKTRAAHLDNSLAGITERKSIRESLSTLEEMFPEVINSQDYVEVQTCLKKPTTIKI